MIVGYNAVMPELVYVQVFLADGKVSAWSSSRGRLERINGPISDLFQSLRPADLSAKVMIHFIGDDNLVTDDERETLMEASRRAGFTVTRIEIGEPMDPEEAFQLMLMPFT